MSMHHGGKVVNNTDVEKEIIRLRESFLKQIMTISSGGLAIAISFHDKMSTISVWYYSAIALWLLSITGSLTVQSILSKYFSSGIEVPLSLYEIEKLIEKKKKTPSDKAITKSDILKKLDDVNVTTNSYFKLDLMVKVFSYLSLGCFVLAVISISLAVYFK
ncbi:hypothetical protein [Alteromonas oceanisediminis]|uniref:hypothetical protein n=1 Tax=Alteromonas oceanisediminis TaxID=2836180 RepID=UPI001BDA6463|nr:hypothetical protein [Alteromonas oceanisediminis]MBT0588115.1 hypothetical protein [Alteromonas oceanisediminis]